MKMQVGNLYIWNPIGSAIREMKLGHKTYVGNRANIWDRNHYGPELKSDQVFCVLEALGPFYEEMDYKILTIQGDVCWIRVEKCFEKDWMKISS